MTPTVAQALAQCGLVPSDARAILAHAVGKNRAWLAAHPEERLTRSQAESFFAFAKRRRGGEPVAYLTGTREFWGLSLAVTAAVLIPRPETEALVEFALSVLPEDRTTRVLDLGTGSGAIALALAHERPRAQVLATDYSRAALEVAQENAQRLAFSNVCFLVSDWYTCVPGGAWDLIVSNPPYVAPGDPHLSEGDLPFEPAIALTADDAGLAALRAIVTGAYPRLALGGWLIVEHGFDQSVAVQALFQSTGFEKLTPLRDLAGIPRIVAGRAGAPSGHAV
ncbi:MAG: peptide chain release factor N(5)-glutamine methyltransferase [Betaproteobacteria bacterium]|nr:peptide chain release factor N(5)-glutamine methyltransferase [Betaproteobacteria bacterium]MBA3776806.1 peptide chain release factor N(5)-glutamine methyltransferase [Betaproteobacteria bacterium]